MDLQKKQAGLLQIMDCFKWSLKNFDDLVREEKQKCYFIAPDFSILLIADGLF